MKCFFTTAYNQDEIVKLRQIAFKHRFKEKVTLDGLNWNKTDANSIHLSYRSSEELLSTLRITYYLTKEKFDKATQIPLTRKMSAPYLLLARAATRPGLENSEIHSKLRVLALEICIQQGIFEVFGSLQKKSKRLEHLLSLGYTILESQDRWPESYLQNDGEVVLICLEGKNKILKFIESERKRMGFFDTILVSSVELKKY